MQPYKYLDNIPNHELISKKVLEYITKYHVDLLESDLYWNNLPLDNVLDHIPELIKVFKDLNLTPNAISLVITTDDNGGPHIDALKGIRFLWPLKNCKNSYTRFLDIDPNNVGIEQLPNGIIYYYSTLPPPYEYIDQVELVRPIVMNPQVGHEVILDKDKNTRMTMTIGFDEDISYMLE